MSDKTVMKLPEDVGGFSMRGVNLEVTETPEGRFVNVPEDLVAEAQEQGLVVIRSPEPPAKTPEQIAAEEKAAQEEAAAQEQAEKEAAEAKAKADAKISVGDTVSFLDGENKLEGLVKDIREGKKVTMVDVEVSLPDTEPEVWEVDLVNLTKVVKE